MLLQHLILATLAILASAMPASLGKDEIPASNNAVSSYLEINTEYHATRKASQEKYMRILTKIENVQFAFSDRVHVLQALVKFTRREIKYIDERISEGPMTREEVIEASLLKSWWLAKLERVLVMGGGEHAPAA
jgi:hypothetical protein